ncbi:MAG: UDP-glucose dehydrogenase family protein [Ramlibacter sp.]
MNITVIGAGYVGLVTGTCLADVGNDVLCVELDAARIERLRQGEVPIYEPGLKELMERNRRAGRLRFTSDVAESVRHGDVQMIAVGTPPRADGSADVSQVLAAARAIGQHMDSFKLVVGKSTVPVGTGERIRATIAEALRERGMPAAGETFSVASNPEFLKEGAAIDDFMRPERIVIGTEPGPGGERAREMLRQMYEPFNRHHDRALFMDVKAAEFTKYAANAMLATRISFMNELANLADAVGVDIEQVRRGIGSDGRIGYSFLYAGTGYGGSCFPKDVRALIHTAQANGHSLRVLRAVEAVNEAQKGVLVGKITARFGENLKGRVFGIWGLAFKPNTDDMREAPSLVIMRALLERGAQLVVHDPVAMDEARRALARLFEQRMALLDHVRYADKPMEAAAGADALVIVTEWQAFKSPNFNALKRALKEPVIFDGRNLYEPAIRQQGFEYHAIGR